MNKNLIWYAVGAVALFYILKKKKIIGQNIEDAAKQLTADKVDKLNFKIDYSNFGDQYKETENSI
jgi:hypothetical protein